ncbi:hypothetical protein BVC93_20370 [Mycobacterium sp. MS1601]|nr:hypothetical protein BVC93_20370 [Mycobacterium sp. MS1601]
MQRLVEALTASVDPVLLTRRIAEQACLFTPKASGAVVSICTPEDHLVIVSAHGATSSQLGLVSPMEGTFQARALQSRRPEVVYDTWDDPRLPPPTRQLAIDMGIRSGVAIPLFHNNVGLGVLSVVAAEPSAFDELDIAAIASLSRLVSALIGSHSELSCLLNDLFDDTGHTSRTQSTARFLAALLIPERADQDDLHDGLDSMLAAGPLRPVFQPIRDLCTRTVVAVEGLCRFPGAGELDAGQWFSRARRLGRGIDLERRALRTILEAAALDDDVQKYLLKSDRKLVVEITEHEPFPDDLGQGLEPLRRKAIQIAVDDAGAGYANLNQILRIQPDIVKIDGELTTAIDRDPVRRALASSIVQLAKELDARIVAEAIECDAQQLVLRRLGVHYGQGYHLGRPAPAQQILPQLADLTS